MDFSENSFELWPLCLNMMGFFLQGWDDGNFWNVYFVVICMICISCYEQGCQFSGNSLNSGPGELFSDHSVGFFVYKMAHFQALWSFLTCIPVQDGRRPIVAFPSIKCEAFSNQFVKRKLYLMINLYSLSLSLSLSLFLSLQVCLYVIRRAIDEAAGWC